jgi:hypothetical protein
MSNELLGIQSSEVTFLETLKQSKYSAIFHVYVRGRQCVLKVVGRLYFLDPSSRLSHQALTLILVPSST